MNRLSPWRFAFAAGASVAVAYLACVIFMAVTPHETVVWLANCMMHGLDSSSIMRDSVPMADAAVGIVTTFVSGWLFGGMFACLHNLGLAKKVIEA